MSKVVGLVEVCEGVSGKDKLKQLRVNVGAGAPLQIVTNAPNVEVGKRVVVALVGSEVGGETVKKVAVGGAMSEGMLCDGPALGWAGGGAGTAALVPDSFAPGDEPPATRPRLGGGGAEQPTQTAIPAKDVEPLFAKKLSKEEKKALAAQKKAEREAKKKAGNAGAPAAAEGDDDEDKQ
jgi:tRNA-binding EMAP/Myf-like protein